MAKINKYWGFVAVGALTAAAAGVVAAIIAKKGSCKEDFDFEDDFDDFDLTDEEEKTEEKADEEAETAEDFQSWEHTGEQAENDSAEDKADEVAAESDSENSEEAPEAFSQAHLPDLLPGSSYPQTLHNHDPRHPLPRSSSQQCRF